MKDIKLISLELSNFKCHRHLKLDFNGKDATIYGDNATGKSSVFDALTWVLFSKSSNGDGDKNFEIKPLGPDGAVKDHEAITAVEAVLNCDGEEVTLKRTFREVWTTRRGSSELTYDGNVSDYYVSGVPCKKNAFDAKVKEICPEELFRMLTSVSHFAGTMKWQDRRAVLFDIAGSLTDGDIMAREERFRELRESMGKLSLSEYKAKLLHEKKGISGVRDDAPARISECQRTLESLGTIDLEGTREEELLLQKKRDSLSAEIIAMEQDAAVQGKRLELRAAKLDRDRIESENRLYREAQRRQGPDKADLERRLRWEKTQVQTARDQQERLERSIPRYDRDIQESWERWVEVNGEAFAGGICPSCGQALPFEKLREATEGFEAAKKQRLGKIEAEAKLLMERKEEALEDIRAKSGEVAERERRVKELEEKLDAASTVTVSDMTGYREKLEAAQEKVDAIQREITALTEGSGKLREEKRRELDAVNADLDRLWRLQARASQREMTLKRIEELKSDMKSAAEALEAIDKMLYAMEEFIRFKCRYVEEKVNDHFRLASFRLFREQANGGLEERCDAQYGGVPYLGLNNGMKVNVGIDIINTLSRYYGVTVPLFIDNAEAVTKLEGCGAQVIRLVVSENDKELRML